MTSVFVSGSRGIARLNQSVRERLDNIIGKQYTVLLGDANGADKAVQSYLDECGYENVVVYCSGAQCRNNIGQWRAKKIQVPEKIKGREFYTLKDQEMASDADYGFVLWDGKSAGALNNIVELTQRNKKAVVYFRPTRSFATVGSVHDIESLLKCCDAADIEKISRKIGLVKRLERIGDLNQRQLGF